MPPSQQQRRSREKNFQICHAVCESIERRKAAGEKAPRKDAVKEVALRFHLGERAIEKAYDDNRVAVELMRQLARAYGNQG